MSYWSPYPNLNLSNIPTPYTIRELGRVTLGGAAPTMTITVPVHRYYLLLYHTFGQASANDISHRIGEASVISSATYDRQYSVNGAAVVQSNDQTQGPNLNISTVNDVFGYTTIANISSEIKYLETHAVERNTAGAGNIVQRSESRCKLPNTSINVDTLELMTVSGANFNVGSELVVLGLQSNLINQSFYELLASNTLGGTSDNLSTGTIPARKYLYIQYYIKTVTGQTDLEMTFNNDTGTNYNYRTQNNGASDVTSPASQVNIDEKINVPAGDWLYGTMYIINDSSREKLCIGHHNYVSTVGAAAAPDRQELVAKWVNTSSQITEIEFTNADAGNYNIGSFIKVWGSN